MELRGEFHSITEVLDLLQIVSLGKKEGEVLFKSGEGNIVVQFKKGKITNFDSNIPIIKTLRENVSSGKVSLTEAAKAIIHYISFWKDGRFVFWEKKVEGNGLGEADTMNIMMEFTKEKDEMPPEIREIIEKNSRFSLSPEIENSVTLDKESWKMLVELSKGLPVKKVLFTACSSFEKAANKLHELLSKGTLKELSKTETAAAAPATEKGEKITIPEEKLEEIKEILTETMGPMGEFLIDETLEELEVAELSPDLVPRFIDALINKIPETCFIEGESCKERFAQEFKKILLGG